MNKKTLICILITAALLIIGTTSSIIIYNYNSDAVIADIYQDGELIQSIDLSTVTEGYQIEVRNENGAVNILDIQPGRIAVADASCPDNVCVRVGYIRNELLPISCLPNHLIIMIRPSSNSTLELDDIAY